MGSYPQPGWLVDRDLLVGEGVPRVRAEGIWKVDREFRQEAIEAAVLSAIADQEAAGVDIITDGEIGRESYFNHFANSLSGVDPERLGKGVNRRGGEAVVPLVSGPIRRTRPIELDTARFLRAHTSSRTKVTVPGPFTLSQLAQNDHYPDQRSLAMAYAAAINAELRDLHAAGIDVLQLDEPYLQANAEVARGFAVEAVAAAVDGIDATTTLHTCYGYALYMGDKSGGYPFLSELAAVPVDYVAIEAAQPGLDPSVVTELSPRSVVLGVLDLGTEEVETPASIAQRIRSVLEHIDPHRLSVSPDCGMKFLPRRVARAKLAAMVEGARIVRSELTA
ncbi:MAG: 5-methyltetrahydropteroyltriglutamate--homocysteine methyltransferase [Acidimicrobiaceae bacterium]|nr:5-methyltetrahydropteroyltriglutamate--homocysteine methyltransferase [Acidimicrobiaceae bacterium]MXZ65225.1 5-methyltetrahydropteroyltriglutamate--homocysteine methyltransferase [Acidimicrobiaceae bacterium]MYA14122.1 5-methyltetrahydropteroyltriglutamate--homocysteine methyltransferase [Acidimicrobiaceae bacterium]MYE65135.1 5-methyltetrahydropteroyltriglutamate--homocysteine methyltransferase [Acidimicrobiaceae bacterium]MYF34555.1 5-methyltetrahydropteroyltriglutamate--homocysteine meth